MRRTNFFFKLLLLLINILALNSSFFIAYIIRFLSFDNNLFYENEYNVLLVFLNLVVVIISIRDNTFSDLQNVEQKKIIISSFKETLFLFISLLILIVALKNFQYSRQFHVYFFICLLGAFLILKFFLFGVLKIYNHNRVNYKSLLFLSDKRRIQNLFEIIRSESFIDYKIKGIYSFDSEEIESIYGYSVLPFDSLNEKLDNDIDELIIFVNDKYIDKIIPIIKHAENKGIRVRIAPNFLTFGSTDLVLEYEYNLPLLRIRPEPLENVNNYLFKRLFDLFVSAVFILFFFPLFYLIVGALIKFTSKGPVFFTQKRTGQLNNEFECIKFRSMVQNDQADSLQTTQNDPRRTMIGTFLRKTNLDELPQFINVLRGDMSLVGPRPHMLKHTDEYSEIIDNYKVRHFCKPGISGWAQVNGFRGETTNFQLMEKRVDYDIWYLENWSFWLDLKILFMTLFYMFKGQEKAY